jgi:hypothetical protein
VEAYRTLSAPERHHDEQEDCTCQDADAWIQKMWQQQEQEDFCGAQARSNHRQEPWSRDATSSDTGFYSDSDSDCGCAPLFEDFVRLQRIALKNSEAGRQGFGMGTRTVRPCVMSEECLTTLIQGSFPKGCECISSAFPGCVVREASCMGYQELQSVLSVLR